MKTDWTKHPRKPPMTPDAVADYIAQMRRQTRSKAARVKMAEMAITYGNITPEGKDLWRQYLTQETAQ